ncbi:MAG: aldehyde dehydrogenase family protein [Pseudomonadota bacterium]
MRFDPFGLDRPTGFFCEGRLQPVNGPVFEHDCPSDARLSLAYAAATQDDVDRAVRCCRRAVRDSGWADRSARERGHVLKRWAELIDAHAESLAALESVSSSRPFGEALARDTRVPASALRTFASYAETHESAVTATGKGQLSLVTTEPHGVVAAIAPWNFPLILSAWKFAPALAAGNAVILKPSEYTPFSALKLAELGTAAGLPDGIFNVLPGDAAVGKALVAHPGIDYVTFTGSSATGAGIMADAAVHGLKPVSLELGGKGAQLVFDDAKDLEKVAGLIVRGITYNSGQVCFAGSRLIVQAGRKDELLEKIIDRMGILKSGPTWGEDVDLPPIINAKQMARVCGIVDQAQADGAECLIGGQVIDANPGMFAYQPTILDGVGSDNAAFKHEIFGPVLSVDTFDDFEEGIAKANHPEYGLAASVYTGSLDRALAASQQIDAGTVWINHWGRGEDMTSPFGGFKKSGLGKDLGRAGFQKYLKSKSVWVEFGDVA